MVLEYYRLGSLHHYLQTCALHVAHGLSFAMSVAEGMAFLHSEISDLEQHGKKPAIVHRNLSSKTIYVKSNGREGGEGGREGEIGREEGRFGVV